MRARFLVLAGLGLVLLLGAGLALSWLWAAEQLSAAIAQWTEAQRARGYQVAYRGPDIGGFPATLSVRFAEPRLSAPQGWRWSGGAIAGEAAVWQPRTLHLDLPRRQRLSATWRGHRRDFSLAAEAARGRIRLGREGRLRAATVEMDRPALEDGDGATTRADYLRYTLVRRPPRPQERDAWTLFLSGETRGLVLPDGAPNPFEARVEQLSFDATLVGLIPRAAPPAQALARWRDGGGVLEVNQLRLAWGPLDVRADGTAALDQRFRPQGVFAARIRGLPEALDALSARGLIEPGVALALKLSALSLAAEQDAAGRPVVELPITLQDGLVYLGPVAVFPLAPVL